MAVQLLRAEGEAGGGSRTLLLSARPPVGARRTPSDVSCVIDVSWSMSMEASVKAASGATESNGLSMLDIAKHAVRTVIQTLNDQDRLCVITFCRQGELVLPLTKMDAAGKTLAEEVLTRMTFGSGTALWQGLHRSFAELHKNRAEDRLSHTMLLTDGETEDSEQLMSYLKESKERFGGSLPGTVSTFGFGYEIDSPLLVRLAGFCDGTYAFIPDAGFVGTIFVNSISNLLATCCLDARLKVEPSTGVQQVLGGHELALGSVRLGSLQYGQSKDVLLKIDSEASVTATLEYTALGGKCCSVPSQPLPEAKEVEVQLCRSHFVDTLARMVPAVKEDISSGKAMLTALAEQVSRSSVAAEERVKALLEDILGQCLEAVAKPEYWERWGKHYVPSVMFAHKLQQCNNFKDPSVQCYGSDLFADIRDLADAAFNKLPAPSVTPARFRYMGGGQ
ncbi:unnamed protein product, partial [Effrenium voratum]